MNPSESDIINVLSIAKLKYANMVYADLLVMQNGCEPRNGGTLNCLWELIEAMQIQVNDGDFTSDNTVNIYNQLYNQINIDTDPNVPEDPNYQYPYTVDIKFIDGVQGPIGPQGPPGADGANGTNGTNGTDGADGEPGATGATGAAGADGAQGDPGTNGADGDSAYQVWLDNGHAGTETDFLNSLKGTAGTNGTNGAAGTNGTNGWSPVFAIVTDGNRRVQQVVDWTGGSGTKPATGSYVGISGFTTSLASAIDIRGAVGGIGPAGAQGIQGFQGATGATGATGAQGATGFNGWSPIFLISADGDRRVLQIADWTGGAGTKPSTGQFISAEGLTGDISLAIDIRGPIGLKGDQGSPGTAGAPGINTKSKHTYDQTFLVDAGGGNYYLPYLTELAAAFPTDIVPLLLLSANVSLPIQFDKSTSPPRLYGFANNATQTIILYVI